MRRPPILADALGYAGAGLILIGAALFAAGVQLRRHATPTPEPEEEPAP